MLRLAASPITRKIQSAGLALVFVAALFASLGASDPTARFDKLGHKLVCQCGCAQILIECNHVGCPVSPRMLTQLQARIDARAKDNVIFKQFVDQYGAIVLAAPIREGFDRVAWIIPPVVFLLALAGTFAVIRNWRLRTAPVPAAAGAPEVSALRDRIRRETEI